MCDPSKNCPIFVLFGAVCGAYAIRPYDQVRAILQNTDAIPRPGMCGPSKNYPVFVSFGAVEWAYSIRPYNRVRVALRNTDVIPDRVRVRVQKMDLYTPPSVTYGGAYSIRPYDRIRAILRNTDAILQLGMCGPSKNYPVFATVGGVWWGIFNTPLRSNTCDSSKYRCDLSIGGAGVFGRWGGGGYRLRGRRA